MIKADIKQLNQRQDSFYDQLLTVHDAAVKLGCYDVADSLRQQIEQIQQRLTERGLR